jgi:hypothetical protein
VVVEVVGDASSQATEHLERLGSHELFFETPAIGHVDEQSERTLASR